jgi:diguanylate cyclase (GGDEF)-like protein
MLIHGKSTDAMGDLKRVLFISSYSESFDSVPLQVKGMKELLTSTDYQVDVEYMDMKRINTAENIELFHTYLKYKLSYLKPYDALIVGDDHALQFAMDYQQELFKNLPIVFLGINDINRAERADENPYITGIYEEISLKDNIELALKFNPKATKIIAFVDATYTGVGDINQFMEHKEEFPNLQFETINTSDYTFDELAVIIENYGEDTILLYLSMYSDKNGTYITIDEAAEFFREHSKVPVYRPTVGGIGKGLIGGKMVSFEDAGKMAAKMVKKVLEGIPIESIDVIMDSPNRYILDYELLQKYNINISLVPPDTTFINKSVGFYEQYKDLVWIISMIITILIIFSFLLVLDNIKQRTTEKALKESHEKLTQTYEELAATEEELRDQYIKSQETTDKIKTLNEKYEISISGTNSAVWEIDIKKKVVHFSENFQNIIGQSVGEYEEIDSFCDKVLEADAKELMFDEYYKFLKEEKSEINMQLPLKTTDNSPKWMMIRGKGIKDSKGKMVMLNGIILDITKTKEQELYIEHLASHDYLTDLPNRLSFMNKLNEEISLDRPLAIMLLDIDNFKEINDTLGHVYGDLLLKEIADRLTAMNNEKIFVSRFGGDEFLILLSEETEISQIDCYIHKILDIFKKPFNIGRKEHFIEISMGITRYPIDSDNMDQLIMNADTAMYRVKHTGKNRYLYYNESMQESLREKAGIESILRRAVKEDGIYLVYQPRVAVQTGEIEGFEALLRLRDHNIPPNVFIKIAEESDLILEIGRKVTKEAIEQLARWKKLGFPPKIVSINFSSKQIRDLNYLEFLDQTLKQNELDPKYLEIEITESILVDETDYTIEFLYALRKLGVKIAMDDFGTGYSSINYLTYIPVDHVKLDKSLSDKFLQFENIKVMNSIISLAHSLDLEITAEGIEDCKQYERLKEVECDYIQGYYFSKPLEVEQAQAIYNKNLLRGQAL